MFYVFFRNMLTFGHLDFSTLRTVGHLDWELFSNGFVVPTASVPKSSVVINITASCGGAERPQRWRAVTGCAATSLLPVGLIRSFKDGSMMV